MQRIAVVAVWVFISVYSFYVLGRGDTGREQTGRKLIGVGALLVAAAVAVPDIEGEFTLGDVLCLLSVLLAAVMLLAGLLLAVPEEWRRAPRAGTTSDLPPPEENADESDNENEDE